MSMNAFDVRGMGQSGQVSLERKAVEDKLADVAENTCGQSTCNCLGAKQVRELVERLRRFEDRQADAGMAAALTRLDAQRSPI